MNEKITFALFFANRGFFPGELIADAREELKKVLEEKNYGYICMEESLTRFGAVETISEGEMYADFLEKNKGGYDGVIVCMPNFGDENGASVALKNAGVPILVQAYPDEIGKMDFSHRRDAMCGKFALCNVLRQMRLPYTLTKQFVVKPDSESFKSDLDRFAAICRVVKGMKSFNVGAIGARTTAFKTVRFDEIAMMNIGINVETIDLSDVFMRMEKVDENRMKEKRDAYLTQTAFSGFPEIKMDNIARLGVVLDDIINEYKLDAVAIRCWSELEIKFGIAPCMVLCDLNERGIAAACELDVNNAVYMRAVSLASGGASTILDFNNNYGEDDNKYIVFHCGPNPISMLKGKGEIIEHKMFKKSFGEGTGVGVNKSELKSGAVTYGSLKSEGGHITAFVSEGEFTDDVIESEFFGSGKVIYGKTVNEVIEHVATQGYKHHLCFSFGKCASALNEAFNKYLGIECKII